MSRRVVLVLVTIFSMAACTRPSTFGGPPDTIPPVPRGTVPDTTVAPPPTDPPITVATIPPTTSETTTTTTTEAPPQDPDPNPNPPDDPPTGPVYSFRTAPQLGAEPVRGTGCGADGSLGATIPDGWWYGNVSGWASTSFQFDVMCVYFGAEAASYIAECQAGPDGDMCLDWGSPEFWVENNNDRNRTVPVSLDVSVFNPHTENCPSQNLRQMGGPALVHIVDGKALYLTTECQGG